MAYESQQLLVGEFVRWMNHIDKRFDSLHEALEDERDRVNDHDRAIAALEVVNKSDNRRSVGVGSVSGMIGGLIAGFVQGWMAGGGKG